MASIYYDTVKLVKAGAVVGDDQASASNTLTTSDAFTTFGGKDELWGTTWTPAQVNASDFGCVISVASSGWSTDYTTHYLKVTDFDFAVPTSSTISGIKVEVEGKYTSAGTMSVAIDRVRMFIYYDAPEYTDVTSVENLLVAVARGNVTAVTDTARMAIVDFSNDDISTGYVFTAGDDFGEPANDKVLQAIECHFADTLPTSSSVTVSCSTDDTGTFALQDITWTDIATFSPTDEGTTKWLETPLEGRRFRFKFTLTGATTGDATGPQWLGYTLYYQTRGVLHDKNKNT